MINLKEIYFALEKPFLSKWGFFVQKFIFFNVILNIFILFVFLFFNNIDGVFAKVLNIIYYTTLIIFLIELIFRYIVIGYNEEYKGFRGRIKYTFNFYTIVDIISVLPLIFIFFSYNIPYLSFIRFIVILKLKRIQKVYRQLFNFSYYLSSNVFRQGFFLFIISLFIIYLFGIGFNSIKISTNLFLSPTYITEINQNASLLLALVEVVIGLIIGGALISIITSAFINLVEAIKLGYLPYKGSRHIVIINSNSKLKFILEEIDKYYISMDEKQDVVILLSNEDILQFRENLENFSSIEVFLVSGDFFNWNSYKKVNINKAEKAIFLLDEKQKNLNKKICRYVLNNDNFNNKNLNFIVETYRADLSKDIYEYIFRHYKNYSIIDECYVIGQILNRSIVNYDYYNILSELLTFDGYEIYVLDKNIFFEKNCSFKEAYLKIENAILIGIVRDDKIIINPKENIQLLKSDKLILIMEDAFTFKIINEPRKPVSALEIKKPSVKENRRILIIGNYMEFNVDDISQFLSDESKNNIKIIIKNSDKEYFNKEFWKEIKKQNFDVIILNLEDNLEYELTIFVRSIFQDDIEFVSKIINIIKEPINVELLKDKDLKNNLILSQKIVGQFIIQVAFNPYILRIFDEITNSYGNEFYILLKKDYKEIFNLDYDSLKSTLISQGIIYIGAFVNGEFIFDLKDINNAEKIVVLCEGVGSPN